MKPFSYGELGSRYSNYIIVERKSEKDHGGNAKFPGTVKELAKIRDFRLHTSQRNILKK